MGYGYGGHMMSGYGGWLLWLVLIILAGLAVYYLVNQQKRSAPTQGPAGEKAVDILKKRYARGEISKEEFESIKRDIGGAS